MLLYDGTCTEFRELNGRSDIGDRCLLHPYKGSSLHKADRRMDRGGPNRTNNRVRVMDGKAVCLLE